MNKQLIQKIALAFEKDPEILIERNQVEISLGSDAKYLEEVLGITKSNLIRLEREGFAIKARYATASKRKYHINDEAGNRIEAGFITGPHRVRWLIFKDVLNEQV